MKNLTKNEVYEFLMAICEGDTTLQDFTISIDKGRSNALQGNYKTSKDDKEYLINNFLEFCEVIKLPPINNDYTFFSYKNFTIGINIITETKAGYTLPIDLEYVINNKSIIEFICDILWL